MLGYTKDDLNEMIDATYLAMHYVPEGQTKLMENLAGTNDFLQGLWAEGYFDQTTDDFFEIGHFGHYEPA